MAMVVGVKLHKPGRENEVWKNALRQVAGCVPVRGNKVLLVTSNHCRNEWILPKGGCKNGESLEDAAARETLEEAGVQGTVGRFLGNYDKVGSQLYFFEMKVTDELPEWLEMSARERRWFDLNDAWNVCQRPEMKQAIQRCLTGR